MKVMLIGGGGREHCIAWKVAQNGDVDELYCIPGNGGMGPLGTNLTLRNTEEMLRFAQEKKIDLTLVGPEAPLAAGIVDLFSGKGCPIMGPDKNAAQLESSKVYAKSFMQKYYIPTAHWEVFQEVSPAISFLRGEKDFPLVIKADGLASGKGVFIVEDQDEGVEVLEDIMKAKTFGNAGDRVIIEQYLEGEEATLMLLFDGETYLILPSSQDHKRVGDGDVGPNTGGMGAYSPAPVVSDKILQKIEKEIIHPLVEGIHQEGLHYRGIIYLGLMISKKKDVSVLEFNVRLGDPESQVVLPRLRNDWIEINLAILKGELHTIHLDITPQPMLGVVLTSRGYPGQFETGKQIEGLELFTNDPRSSVLVFHAATEEREEVIYSSGGRVLNVCAFGEDLKQAAQNAYNGAGKIRFENIYYRHDIGYRAFHREE
ncbi:MAG: phosphoribosylamine--glycine ligase [Candidatus Atribacteria bacterium]|nr:phosphoribosylamine--glycine ligase [Candidatus Atribacteria bacterium]